PSLLYRQAETRRYRRPRRTIPEKVQQEDDYEDVLRHIGLIFKYLKHLVITATSWALSSSDDEILVGGQAVIEGVMMRSPKGYSVAVRRQDGTIRVMKDALLTLSEKWKVFKTPIVRGVGVLGQALVLGIKALRFSAEEALTEEGKPDAERKRDSAQPQQKAQPSKKDPAQLSSWLIAGNMVLRS